MNVFYNRSTLNNQGWPTSWRAEGMIYEYDRATPSRAPSGWQSENAKNRLVQVLWSGSNTTAEPYTGPNLGTNLFSYDAEGNLASFHTQIGDLAGKEMAFTYNRQNRLFETRYNEGESDQQYFVNLYDVAGRLFKTRANWSRMSGGSGSRTISWSEYDNRARETRRKTFYTTFFTDLTYDVRGRLLSSHTTRGGQNVFRTALRYADNSLIESVESETPAHPSSGADHYRYVFSYDRAGRLVEGDYQTRSGSSWANASTYDLEAVAYDGDGNLTSLRRRGPGGVDAFSYEQVTGAGEAASGRLASVRRGTSVHASFGYDANGAATRVTGTGAHFRDAYYSRTGLLYELKPGATSNERVRYLYDPNGQRVYSSSSGGRYDVRGPGGEIVAVYNSAGALQHHDFGAAGRRDADGTRVAYLADHLGSMRMAMTTSGAVKAETDCALLG